MKVLRNGEPGAKRAGVAQAVLLEYLEQHGETSTAALQPKGKSVVEALYRMREMRWVLLRVLPGEFDVSRLMWSITPLGIDALRRSEP